MVYLCFVFLVGGASRADVTSLLGLRPISACAAVWFAFQLTREQWRDIRVPLMLLATAIVIVAIQLVPLPPSMWHMLPGREGVIAVDRLAHLGEPWRPISLTPPETRNALVSLFVPLAMLFGAATLDERGRRSLIVVLLGLAGLCVLLSVLQLGGGSSSPFYFYKITNRGMMVGLFANRNHNAMFIACLLPMLAVKTREWMQLQMETRTTKLLIGLSTALVMLPVLAAVGSRMGFLVGIIGAVSGIYIVSHNNRAMWELARKYRLIIGGAVVATLLILVSLVVRFGSAVQRTTSLDSSEIRFGIWRTSWQLVETFWPFGSGFGSFVPVYKANEPISTLEPSYINHAHNDYIEVLSDGGILAAAVLLMALAVFSRRFIGLLFAKGKASSSLNLLGASLITIMLVASASDYPLRVPSLMALLAIASVWFFASRPSQASRL